MNAVFRVLQGLLNRHDGPQHVVFDLDVMQRRLGGFLIHCRHGCHRITHVAHLLWGEGVLILIHRHNAERGEQVSAGDHCQYTGQGGGFLRVNAHDVGVRMRTAQELAVEQAGQEQIIGVLGNTGDFAKTIDARREGAADDVVMRRHTHLRGRTKLRQLLDVARPVRLPPGF